MNYCIHCKPYDLVIQLHGKVKKTFSKHASYREQEHNVHSCRTSVSQLFHELQFYGFLIFKKHKHVLDDNRIVVSARKQS